MSRPFASSDSSAWKMFVFRKVRQQLSGRELKKGLAASISTHSVEDALVRAGELETGMADAGCPDTEAMMSLVDALARTVISNVESRSLGQILLKLERIRVSDIMHCSHPEGFSYYGLHPLDFADVAQRVELHSNIAAVIGIRSIGTTLSAVVKAALERRRIKAARTTVRPVGDPYHRRAFFSERQHDLLVALLQQGADFLIVDEGPGFSGSTFLSVARALGQLGVATHRIQLLASRPVALEYFDRGYADEWSRLRSYTAECGTRVPAANTEYIGGGIWRARLFSTMNEWPACWTQLERIKHLSADRETLFKFEGLGRFGEQAYRRAIVLADAGFAPTVSRLEHGFFAYAMLPGRSLQAADRSEILIKRFARYCALRTQNFPFADADNFPLEEMLRENLKLEFGFDWDLKIPLEMPVITDSAMMPHEWVSNARGEVLKTDGVSHGDSHLVPGPTDIAWDLAGLIEEWELSEAEMKLLISEYRRVANDDPTGRLPLYRVAYQVFRMAFCKMGAAAMDPWPEAQWLGRQYRRFRRRVARQVGGETCGDRLANARIVSSAATP